MTSPATSILQAPEVAPRSGELGSHSDEEASDSDWGCRRRISGTMRSVMPMVGEEEQLMMRDVHGGGGNHRDSGIVQRSSSKRYNIIG